MTNDSTLGALLGRVRVRAAWFIRDRWPNRPVMRDVSGVRMLVPWSHRVPDFTRFDPAYAENLFGLAELLADPAPLFVIDVGANVGDSALPILKRVDARVLAVEPDEKYLRYLYHNIGDDSRVTVEPSLVTVGDEVARSPIRSGGTTTFVGEPGAASVPTVRADELASRHPDFQATRLIKSDTDGFDVQLVPALARAFSASRPVLFFEYDHRASTAAGNDALDFWPALRALGYAECAIWDNGGHPVARCSLDEAEAQARVVQPSSPGIFWDVAAVHADDAVGLRVIDSLIPPTVAT